MSKQVASRAPTTVGEVIDYGNFAGQGFEGQSQADISIPFITVLQGLSPQVERIDGAKVGMLINTVTEELYKGDEGLLFVPALTQHVFVEWVPRAKGGGFVGVHPITDEAVVKATELARVRNAEIKASGKDEKRVQARLDNGNDVIETFYIYGALCDEELPLGMAVIACTSTKIKAYKKFNTRVRTHLVSTPSGRVNPPMFANLTRLLTTKEKNSQGEFYNFDFQPANGSLKDSLLRTDDPRFLAAIDVKKMVESGKARAAFESQDAAGGDSPSEKTPF